jgi:phenylpyruvate tautomerase PptA (4-oxalocrotonate tautomerase family)
MPLYEIAHCIPLSREQKDALAEFITSLHATTFATPRLFVNVSFTQPPPIGAIYSGAKFRGQTVPNHIRATIRIGPTRTKEKYDQVALQIQQRWNEVVNDSALGAPQSYGNLTADQERLFKKLHGIVFTPMVAAVEGGLVVPGVSRNSQHSKKAGGSGCADARWHSIAW